MKNEVTCTCGSRFAAATHLAGQRVACPNCGQPIDVPYVAQPSPASVVNPTKPAIDRRRHNPVLYILGGGLFVLLCLMCVGGIFVVKVVQRVAEVANRVSPSLPVQQEDYADARAGFQTTLTRSSPAPQEYEVDYEPAGATAISYTSDGHSLRVFVDPAPSDGQARPAVVFLHGGFAYGDGDWEMGDPYRAAGFVVAMPVLRGENGQPGSFSLYYDEVNDVLAATEVVAALPYVDPENLFVAGHSAGGTLAALTALSSDRYRAAASFSGVTNIRTLLRFDPSLAVFDTSNEREILMRSPQAFARSFQCPVRLYYGLQESWLRFGTQQTAKTAQAAGKDVRTQPVPGDHFTSVSHATRHSISFFQSRMTEDLGTIRLPALPSARSIPRPQIPKIEMPKMPEIEMPEIPEIDMPTVTEMPTRPQPPTLPPSRLGPMSRSKAMVVFQMLGYEGDLPANIAAHRALRSIHWVDSARITVDQQAGTITVGVRGNSVQTGAAKAALQSAGFKISGVSYQSSGS